MSNDENRPLPSSSRPVERVVLPPGPARDLHDAIYRVYAEAGRPRLDALAKIIADDDTLPGVPKKDLIGKVIGGQTLATREDCATIAVALAREAGRENLTVLADQIRAWWIDANMEPPGSGITPPPLGRPISACDPIALEVHRAIDVARSGDQLAALPAYVERAHDRRLREIADQVIAGASRMITLVGGSSTGKTRACWELAQYVERQQPGRWRVWHPYDPTRPEAAADEVGQVGPHTIVWLNEAQLYLAPSGRRLGERIAAGLRTLLTGDELTDDDRGPVLVLATMWPGHWTALTSRPGDEGLADPHEQARQLLNGTDVDVPDAFTTADLTDLGRQGDPRLRLAGRHATGGRITQYLAGAPLLLDRYRKAPPAARAVLDVAIDARRLGHLPAIPHAFLERAAAGYLDDDQWNLIGADWFEEALAYVGQPCNGARGPLTPIRARPGEPAPHGEPVYRLADYLEQAGAAPRANVYPPACFWNAAATLITEPATLQILGRAAEHRGRYRHAASLYRATTDHGDMGAISALVRLLEQAGDHDSAADLCREAAELGNTDALSYLAFRRERAGDPDNAASLYRQASDRGDTGAPSALARLHQQSGVPHGEIPAARQAPDRAYAGDIGVLSNLARRERGGDPRGAGNQRRETADYSNPHDLGARQRRQAAERADTIALIGLARLREEAGDRDGAVAAARQAADRGYTAALTNLAYRCERLGDQESAVSLAQEAADRGNPVVLGNLARRRERAGDPQGAARLYREAADRGNITALINLARLREQAGDLEGADNIRRFGLTEDGSPAGPWTTGDQR